MVHKAARGMPEHGLISSHCEPDCSGDLTKGQISCTSAQADKHLCIFTA